MQKTSSCNATARGARPARYRPQLPFLLLACLLLPLLATAAQAARLGENLSGFYAREGNNDTPAQTAGNNIYIKFFDDRWIGMLFIPYPYASAVGDDVVSQVFAAARKQTSSAAFLKGRYGLLDEPATIQLERYGYLDNRIIFECGALSPCTIRLGEDGLELIKPGIINEHIIRYRHVAAP